MKLFDRLDAIPSPSPEEAQILDSVRALARNEIAPRAEHYDRSSEFPWDNVRAINALGLNAIFVPESYGGAGLNYAVYLACVREISKACASTGIIWATNFHAMKPLVDFGSEEQKRRLLPRVAAGALAALAITEPSAGSDATHMTTRFTPDGDKIVVSGGKTFITSGDVADLILVFGKWAGIPDDRRAISVLILEKGTPGLKVLRKEDKMGHRASSTAALAFQVRRTARQPARRAWGRAAIAAHRAQQVAAECRRLRARDRPRRLRGFCLLYQRAPAIGPADRGVPRHPVHARRPRHRARFVRGVVVALSLIHI